MRLRLDVLSGWGCLFCIEMILLVDFCFWWIGHRHWPVSITRSGSDQWWCCRDIVYGLEIRTKGDWIIVWYWSSFSKVYQPQGAPKKCAGLGGLCWVQGWCCIISHTSHTPAGQPQHMWVVSGVVHGHMHCVYHHGWVGGSQVLISWPIVGRSTVQCRKSMFMQKECSVAWAVIRYNSCEPWTCHLSWLCMSILGE